MYKVICNYLHLNAGNAQVCLSSFQLNEELHCLLHIQQSPHCFDSFKKKMTPLNTPHQTLRNTLTVHSKHTKCHKSVHSQNSLSLSPSLSLSLPQLPPVPQQPNHMVCHMGCWGELCSDWLWCARDYGGYG